MNDNKLIEIYNKLSEYFGPQNWWPGESRFEIIIGAILTQNTNWGNVEKAIANLKKANILDPASLYKMPNEKIAKLIRPAGYFNIKAKRLRNLLDWLFEKFGGDVDGPENMDVYSLREELLGIKGVGPETADSIILYAYNKPIFVVDTYTCRILGRHGLIDSPADYHTVQDFITSSISEDVQFFNEFHALIVMTGKDFCKKRPKCEQCPLNDLPHEIEEY